MTSRVVFGKEAKDLTIAEQFVLASAVNKPIILLEGSEQLNEVRLDRWRYITEVRARTCAERLIEDAAEQATGGVRAGQPRRRPARSRRSARSCRRRSTSYAPALARRAQANPMIRANALLPAARFGMREEMKQAYGFGWREQVRGVTTTLDVVENLAFARAHAGRAGQARPAASSRQLNPGFTLDPAATVGDGGPQMPHVIVVAANTSGEIVRYFEAGETAALFRLAVRARRQTAAAIEPSASRA